jgi:hypothetical protein
MTRNSTHSLFSRYTAVFSVKVLVTPLKLILHSICYLTPLLPSSKSKIPAAPVRTSTRTKALPKATQQAANNSSSTRIKKTRRSPLFSNHFFPAWLDRPVLARIPASRILGLAASLLHYGFRWSCVYSCFIHYLHVITNR